MARDPTTGDAVSAACQQNVHGGGASVFQQVFSVSLAKYGKAYRSVFDEFSIWRQFADLSSQIRPGHGAEHPRLHVSGRGRQAGTIQDVADNVFGDRFGLKLADTAPCLDDSGHIVHNTPSIGNIRRQSAPRSMARRAMFGFWLSPKDLDGLGESRRGISRGSVIQFVFLVFMKNIEKDHAMIGDMLAIITTFRQAPVEFSAQFAIVVDQPVFAAAHIFFELAAMGTAHLAVSHIRVGQDSIHGLANAFMPTGVAFPDLVQSQFEMRCCLV